MASSTGATGLEPVTSGRESGSWYTWAERGFEARAGLSLAALRRSSTLGGSLRRPRAGCDVVGHANDLELLPWAESSPV